MLKEAKYPIESLACRLNTFPTCRPSRPALGSICGFGVVSIELPSPARVVKVRAVRRLEWPRGRGHLVPTLGVWKLSQSKEIDPTEILLREVDDEVRQEQLMKLLSKYSPYIVGLVFLITAGMAGTTLYRQNELAKTAAASAKFQIAADLATQGKHEDALAALNALAAPAPYNVLAQLRAASEYAANGDSEKALALNEEVAKNAGAPVEIRDLAALRAIQIKLDKMTLAEAQAALAPLMANAAPFRYSAREFLALVALRTGDNDLARAEFQKLSQEAGTPQGLRRRAVDILDTIGAPANSSSAATATKAKQ